MDQPAATLPRRVQLLNPADLADDELGDFCVVLSCDGEVGGVVGGYPSFDAALSDTERLQRLHGDGWDAVVFPLGRPLV